MVTAIVYTKDFCPYCVKAKTLLRQNGVIVEEIDGKANFVEMVEKVEAEGATARTFPQIWLDGGYIGGYDQLKQFYDSLI